MKLAYKCFSIILGFAALLTVLVINTAITRRQLAVQNSNQDWVRHTQEVLLELSTVESLLKDAETGQRGFLYTGESQYLAPYDAAVSALDSHLDSLAALTADNPTQKIRISSLRSLSHRKLDELKQTISIYRGGDRNQARALVLAGEGRLTMDSIRDLSEQLRRNENSLLQTRLGLVAHSTTALVRTIYLASCFAVGGLVFLAFYILREMREREKHAAEIREREEWFRVTLGSIGDAVIATDKEGMVTFLNPIAEELTGIKIANGYRQPIETVFPIFNERTGKPAENPVARVLADGRIVGMANHTVLHRGDGKVIPIEDSAAPIFDDQKKLRGVVMVFRDVTAQKQSETVLRKAERLAAAGRLAATVAHEINNPLEAVGNLLYLMKGSPGLSEETQGYLAMAEQELERVSHITRQTLGFYRDSAVASPVEMRRLIDGVLRLYDNKLKSKNIRVEIDAAKIPPVKGFEGELKQLLANLISNAADAVRSGGHIRISIEGVANPEGDGIEIKVADDGPGVAPELHSQIFDAFFTTKEDVGTGLGLWVSRNIAERHGGALELEPYSSDGLGGAVFRVFLPFDQKEETIGEAV